MNFSAEFPVIDQYTYLNTASSGILSNALRDWRSSHDQEFLLSGSNFRLQQAAIVKEVRANLSRLFGSKQENTFLVPNASFGINTMLNGLDKKHRVLLLAEDYPSVNYPVSSSGFDHFEVQIDENLEHNILAAIKNFKPSIFAFSLVQYISGVMIDPEFIKTIKESHPDILLLCDGTQFCGTAKFDFESSGLDALISSGYKWMLAGYGNGFVFLSDQLKDQLYRDRKKKELPAAPFLIGRDYLSLCFEPGHLDTLNFGSLNQSVLYLQGLGLEKIEKIIQSVCDEARSEFYARGLITPTLIDRKAQSGIMTLPLKPLVVKKLTDAKILCQERGTGTRFSFHFYNTKDDLAQLLTILDDN